MKLRTLAAQAGVGAVAGAAAGTAAGAGARVSMRMLADGFPDHVIQVAPVFTIAGTATILIFGALIGHQSECSTRSSRTASPARASRAP